jgi:hypothetical protein
MKNPEEKKGPTIQVQVTATEKEQVVALAKRLSCSQGEVLRRGLPHLVKALEAEAAGEQLATILELSGDAATRAWKEKALTAARAGNGVPLAAKAAGVSQRTVHYALNRDPVFRQLFDEARALQVDRVERTLIDVAKVPNPRHVMAMLAVLNAHHPCYGQPRMQSFLYMLRPFIDRIVVLVEKYVPAGLQQPFCEELSRDAEQVALEAASGKR